MKLAQLATKPKLIKLVIDDEATVGIYGDHIEFWVYDRQPMETFMAMATANSDNIDEISKIIIDLIRDEDGQKMIEEGAIPPADIMIKVINLVVETLGNSRGLTTEK